MPTRKILIVDDNEYDRVLISRSLSRNKDYAWEIEECHTGQEATQSLLEKHYDCVLLDYILPDDNGIQIKKKIRHSNFETPIVLMTGNGCENVAIEAFKNGAQDYVVKGRISEHNLPVVLVEAIARKEEEVSLIKRANFDALTGLVNRNVLPERIDQAIIRSDRSRVPFAVMYIDLNKFKKVNDTYGHDTGDLILKNVAERLMRSVRGGDTVARMGGDEFVAIVENLTHDHVVSCTTTATRMLDAIAHEVADAGGPTIDITGSMGIAFYPSTASRREDLIRLADQAMYQAKRTGEGIFRFADSGLAYPTAPDTAPDVRSVQSAH